MGLWEQEQGQGKVFSDEKRKWIWGTDMGLGGCDDEGLLIMLWFETWSTDDSVGLAKRKRHVAFGDDLLIERARFIWGQISADGEVVESTFNMTALLHHIADICTYIDDYHIAVFLWYM